MTKDQIASCIFILQFARPGIRGEKSWKLSNFEKAFLRSGRQDLKEHEGNNACNFSENRIELT